MSTTPNTNTDYDLHSCPHFGFSQIMLPVYRTSTDGFLPLGPAKPFTVKDMEPPPDPTWGMDEMGKYVQRQRNKIANINKRKAIHVYRLGEALLFAKVNYDHGEWCKHLGKIGVSGSSATRARQLVERAGAIENVIGLEITEAYRKYGIPTGNNINTDGHIQEVGPFSKLNHNIKHRIKPNDEFYTPSKLANYLVTLCPLNDGDIVLDSAYGTGIFYDCYPTGTIKLKTTSFFDWDRIVDWIISNPPYSKIDLFLEHSCDVATKGFAYLLGLHNLTPKRIEICENKGFYITQIHLSKVFHWYGISAFVIWEKDKPPILNYDRTVWKS